MDVGFGDVVHVMSWWLFGRVTMLHDILMRSERGLQSAVVPCFALSNVLRYSNLL